jgi:acetyl esterase/lipase
LRWLNDHAAELSVGPGRVGVMGDSAGGGMAAALTILARERGDLKIARQILLMPMLDDRTRQVDFRDAAVADHGLDDLLAVLPRTVTVRTRPAGGVSSLTTTPVIGSWGAAYRA